MASTQDFIVDVELSAKKILRDANRKQKDAARHEAYEASKAQKAAEKAMKRSQSTVVIPTVTDRLDKKVSLLANADVLESPSQTFKKTRVMQYSIPRMVITMGTSVLDEPAAGDTGPLKSMMSPRQLSPIKTRNQQIDEKLARRSQIYEKLQTSPYLSQSAPSLNALFEEEKVTEKALGNVDVEAPLKQTDWALKIHASAVFAGKTKSKRTFGHAKQPSDTQGPVDWSSEGLRAKYRGEEQREQAWQAFQDSNAYVTQAVDDEKLVLPVLKMERHPMYVLYFDRLEAENMNSKLRTKNRLRMKRFVMDVQEVWLSNLQHLKEHQPVERFFASRPNTRDYMPSKQSAGGARIPITEGAPIPPNREENWVDGAPPNYYDDDSQGGTGLSRRRDVDAILNMSSQIQSVSADRAMEATYHTGDARFFPEPAAELDWVPAVPPVLEEPPAVPYSLESLVAGTVMKTVSGRAVLVLVDRLRPPRAAPADASSSSAEDGESVVSAGQSGGGSSKGGAPVVADASGHAAIKKRKAPPRPKSVLPREPEGTSVWRVSVIRMEDARVRYHYASEAFVDAFVSAAMAERQFLSPKANAGRSEVEIVVVNTVHELRWGRTEITSDVTIKVIRPDAVNRSLSHEALRDSGRVVVTAQLKSGFEDFAPLSIVISAVEFLTIANVPVDPPSGPFSALVPEDATTSPFVQPWWALEDGGEGSHSIADSHFERLLQMLLIAVGDENEQGDSIPATLVFKDDSAPQAPLTAARADLKHKGSALSAARASAFAHFLLGCAEISFDDLAVSVSFAKKGSNSVVSLDCIPWKEALVTATSGAYLDQLMRRPRLQSTLMSMHAGGVDPPDGRLYSGGLNDVTISRELPYNSFEDMADDLPSLSLRASGGAARMNQVPGAIECGKTNGLWFNYPLHPERTHAAANMFRDRHLSSTDSVLVNVTLALDTSILSPMLLAWDPSAETPQRSATEPVLGAYVSMRTSAPKKLLGEKLDSPLEVRNSPVVMAFNTIPELGTDYVMPTGLHMPKGMFRRYPDVDDHGFRRKKLQTLLGVDPELPTVVFGITKSGAIPNTTGVHTRNVWHADVAVTEHINRSRGPKDYHYVVHNDAHQGANNPATFAVKLHHMAFASLLSSSFEAFEKKYDFIAEQRARFARQLALEAKIENSEVVLKTRDKEFASSIRDATQRSIDKKMRKANKSELGWRQRYFHSSLVEVVDNWERRKDDRSGMYFFHRLTGVHPSKEKFLDTCQWEVPMTWDRDLLLDVGSEKTVSVATFSAASGSNQGAFEEPGETWIPLEGDPGAASMKEFKTPGIKTTGVKKLSDFEPAQYRRSFDQSVVVSAADTVSANASSDSGGVPAAGDARSGVDAHDPNKDMDHLAKALLSNDELMRALCVRLGLPLSNIVPNRDIVPGSLPGTIRNTGGASVSSLGSISSVGFPEDPPGGAATHAGSTMAHQKASGGGVPRLNMAGSGQVNSGGNDPRDYLNPALSMGKIRGDKDDVDIEDGDANSDDDDLWSDDDQQVGSLDFEGDAEIGDLPQSHKDVAAMKAAKKRAESMTGDGIQLKQQKDVPESVPFINLEDNGLSTSAEDSNSTKAKNWRKLPRPALPANFFQKCTQVRTLGPDKDAADTLNNPVFLLPISPVDACNYVPENFTIAVESIFIHDARKDMERVIATIDRNIQKEETLAADLPTNDLLLFGEAKELTTVDTMVHDQYKQDKGAASKDAKQVAIDKAILAAKSSSLAEMEDALEEEIPVDSIDQFGNTLLILAAQQVKIFCFRLSFGYFIIRACLLL
jgi:hypothetical protein